MSIVQAVPYTAFGGGASKVITVSATTPGNSNIVLISADAGTTAYTAPGVTDNASGGSNTYVVRKTLAGVGGTRIVWVVDCLNAPKSCTQITITPTGGSGGVFGCGGVLEAGGGTYAPDQSGSTTGAATSPLVVTNSSVDTGATNLVVGVVGRGNGTLTTGISDPPTGYTSLSVQQNDQSDGAGECCYRINSSALTDSVSWASTAQSSGDPGILQSYTVTATAAPPNNGGIAGLLSAIGRWFQAAVFNTPNLLMTTLAVAAVMPPGEQLFASAPVIKKDVSAFQQINRLTLGIPAPPTAPPMPLSAKKQFDSAPVVIYKLPQVDVYRRPLTLGIANPGAGPPLPLSSATVDASAPTIKYQPQVDIFPYPLTLIPAAPTFLPLAAQTIDASAPAVKYNVQLDEFLYSANDLLLGIPVLMPAWNDFDPTPTMQKSVSVPQAVNLLPLQFVAPTFLPLGSQTVDQSAPAVRTQPQLDVYPYPLTLVPSLLPLGSQTVDASAPAVRSQPQVDVYPYPLTLGIPAPTAFLPLGSQTVDASAPATRYQPLADVYPYPLPLGIPAPGAGPPLPLSSATWDVSAPAVKYQPQVDVYPYPLTLGIPAPPVFLPLGSQTVDQSAPAVRYQPQLDVYPYPLPLVAAFLPLGSQTIDASAPIAKWIVQSDTYANRLPLIPVSMPFLPVDTTQLQLKYSVYAHQPPRPLTLGVNPPGGPRPLQLSASAPITKYAVYSLMFPTTIYLPSSTELPALTFYDFEAPLAFMSDFDVTVTFGGVIAPALLSEPGADILGGRIESNQYEIEYVTSQLTLSFGDEVTIQGTIFTVMEVTAVDDGVFTRARLEGSPFINQSYTFEAPDAFLTDFATEAVVLLTSQAAEVIMSQPGQNLMGNRISSNQYEIEYATVELNLAYSVLITIRGTLYKVIQTYALDDGVFSRAKLETT